MQIASNNDENNLHVMPNLIYVLLKTKRKLLIIEQGHTNVPSEPMRTASGQSDQALPSRHST